MDLETFGYRKKACIVQIGACYFDRVTGEIGNKFKENVDARTSVACGGEIDADTVYWWLSQSPEAIHSVTKSQPGIDVRIAISRLDQFLSEAKCIWSHATFDFVILQETWQTLFPGVRPTFQYRASRDIRTLVDLAGVSTKKGRVREGTHHDALDDCIFQVGYCVEAMRKLGV